jgi:hypothetical protein
MYLYSYVYKCSCRQCYVYLRHDFYNIIFKIKHKLYIAPGLAPQGKILGARLNQTGHYVEFSQ